MKMYNSFCYESLEAVSASIGSNYFIGDGYVVIDTTISGSNINVTARKELINQTYTITPPSCTKLGFDNSYSGLSPVDALEIGALCTLVMASAFYFKVLKRGL